LNPARPVFDSGLPYSNIVRDKSKRLSGLHFTKYDAYYPLPDIADLVQSVYNDEELLYSIVERKGFLYNNDKYYAVKKRRPIHCLHLSLNRLPFSYHKERVSWGMSYQHLEAAHKIFESSEFNSFLGTLYTGSAQVIMNLIYISQGVCSFGEDYFTRMITAPQKMSARSEKLTSRSYIKERFSAIYQKNDWGSPESKSGPSSTIKRTSQIRKELPELFKRHSVKSVLDAPCGDLNWMSTLIRQGHIERYIGCDIVDSLIDENKQKFADLSNVSFISVDIIKDDLPASDMLLCRDCLFHFSYFDIQKFMTNFVNSEIPFLLTTSHYNKSGFVNKDIATGGWRWFDLFSAPFLFSSPIECIPDGADRELCLFKKEQIIEFLGEWKQQEIAVVI
jgi:SAM-dependent methyltransferase